MSLPEISALTRVLARSDAKDARQQARNLERLDELCAYLDGHADPGSAACLSACSALIATLAAGRMPDERAILHTVCKLMATVEKHWSGNDPDGELATALYVDGGPAEGAGEELRVSSRVHGAKETVFQVGNIEVAQQRIDQMKRTPRINEMVLGELLVELGQVTQEDIDAAIEEQTLSGELLGDVLVGRGKIEPTALAETVQLQARLRAESTLLALSETPAPKPAKRKPRLLLTSMDVKKQRERNDDNTLGAILMRQGAITEAELRRALDVQRASGLRLGETLVEMHATCWETVNRATELQRRLREAAGLRGRAARGWA